MDGSTGNTIEYNNIVSNGKSIGGEYHWNFYNDQADNVQAMNNYWGATDNGTIDAGIHDDDEEADTGKVIFEPYANESFFYEPPIELHGDVNQDGLLTTADAALAMRMAVGGIDIDLAADVDLDGAVTSLDVLIIMQAVSGTAS
jgi:hypothetical protein